SMTPQGSEIAWGHGSGGDVHHLRHPTHTASSVRWRPYGATGQIMEAATRLPFSQVRTQGDRLWIDGLVVDDACAVRLAREREQRGEDVSRPGLDAIAAGARARRGLRGPGAARRRAPGPAHRRRLRARERPRDEGAGAPLRRRVVG